MKISRTTTFGIIAFLLLFGCIQKPLYSQRSKNPSQAELTTRILFVFDASQSMYGQWQSDIKINIARNLLSHILDSLKTTPNLQMALRVYGHMKTYPPQDCSDTRLEVPFAANNADRIENRLKTLIPKGTTPIAYALEQTQYDFPECDNCRNVIVLITDGIEECGGDPCAVSKALQKKGIFLKPFIIGIGRNFKDAFDCVGTYFDASSERSFRKALKVVISQALNATTAQVNLLDENNYPSETNVNMTFYDHLSGRIKYNYIHTINSKGVPDTLIIDPLLTYDIVVHTLPPVRVDSVRLVSGKHTIIPVKCPQGYLKLKSGVNARFFRDLVCLVKQDGRADILNTQYFGSSRKYLTGKYDLEVLCLPRLTIDDVLITQNHTTTVEIPQPGIVVIQKSVNGYGSLYVEENGELRWIHDLGDKKLQESLLLQPGAYRIVFRSKYLAKSLYTIDKKFRVESGTTINVKLFDN